MTLTKVWKIPDTMVEKSKINLNIRSKLPAAATMVLAKLRSLCPFLLLALKVTPGSPSAPVSLEWRDVSLSISKKGKSRVVLDKVSGSASPGRLLGEKSLPTKKMPALMLCF